MEPNTSITIKRKSFAAQFCSCISWKSKKLISSAHMNTQKWKNFTHKREKQTLPLIFALLLDLYDGQDVYEGLEACRINPDFASKYETRNDLEYYVPQLTNFLVFHNDFSNEKLQHLLAKLSIADPYFAHLYYWYLSSLSMDVEQAKGQKIVNEILETCSNGLETQVFVKDYENFYWALEKKLPRDEYDEKIKEIQLRQGRVHQHIEQYKSSSRSNNSSGLDFELKGSDLDLRPYISPFFEGSEAYFSNHFTSTLLFFEDLSMIAQAMNKSDNKLKFLKKKLHKINKILPSSIYIPFVGDYIRCHAILGIVLDETRVFSTKERAPFNICLELFKPHEELAHEYNSLFPTEEQIKKAPKAKAKNMISLVKRALLKHKSTKYIEMGKEMDEKVADEEFKISKLDQMYSSPLTLKQKQELVHGSSPTRIDSHRPTDNYLLPAENVIELTTKLGPHREEVDIPVMEKQKSQNKGNAKTMIDGISALSPNYEVNDPSMNDQKPPMVSSPLSAIVSPFHAGNALSNYLKNDSNEEKQSPVEVIEEEKKIPEPATFTEAAEAESQKHVDIFFGEDSKDKAERIRQNSPFKDLRTWRLLNLIVKNGADMKEEQFALQLISQFNQIFKAEKLKLILTDFEIISIGSDIGLVEVVQDAITFSSLKEKMYQQGIPSLNDFFVQYFGKDVDKARKRFCRSLAAYSLICYFLQIKDRHNGNIMLHKQGHVVHIDFGFFLSSAPGKGLEFEKKVPFKLLNEYIEVLGGFRSSLFQEFRKLFYKGFMAARKHREQILILVKMMYSSQGHNLPCFKAGLKTISDLEQRFCPDGVAEKDLMGYCYNLINHSVDNWRAKCYDKFQYYVQGIHY